LNIHVEALTITSVGDCTFSTLYEGESGVSIHGSTDVDLANVNISGAPGDAVGLGAYQAPGCQCAG
jgi:hypothetical protein